MKKSVVLFILVLVANSGFGQSIRNSILGTYTGTYWDYANSQPVVQAGAKIIALPADTSGIIVIDTLNNIIDTLYVYLLTNTPEGIDTILTDIGMHLDGDIIPARDSVFYSRHILSTDINPSSEFALKCISHAFPTLINDLAKSRFSLYPNPAVNKLHIENAKWKYKSYNIIDIYGKVIDSGLFVTEIDIGVLPNGIFILQLLGDNIAFEKFIKN